MKERTCVRCGGIASQGSCYVGYGETYKRHWYKFRRSTVPGYKEQCQIRKENRRKETGFYRSEARHASRKKHGWYTYAKRKDSILRYAKRHPERLAARYAVRMAVKRGTLTRESCSASGCSNIKTHAHHYAGYAKEHWLDVVWLCQEHHEKAHHD